MTVDKCNNAYYRIINMKKGEVAKFKIGDIDRISKYRNILQKTMFKVGLKKVFVLQKLKILFRGHMLLVTLKAKKLLERFTKDN